MTTHEGTSDPSHTMQCMEVWGGNEASNNGVVMTGLDAWVYSRPHAGDAGGGDVHYVSSCATGRITRVLIADVSGHGQGVADVAVTLRNLMRRYINFVDQKRLVRSLNKEFTALSEMGRFATAVVATYWAPTNDLVVCNEGHPVPMVYRAKSKTWSVLKSGPAGSASGGRDLHGPDMGSESASSDGGIANLPLGIDDLSGYEQSGVRLRERDLVLMYTDSVIECKVAATGRQLGEDGLIELLGTIDVTEPNTIIPNVVRRLEELAQTDSLDDDLTILLLRHNGVNVRTASVQSLLAPFRIVGSMLRRLVRGEAPTGLPEVSVPTIGGAVIPALGRRWKPKK